MHDKHLLISSGRSQNFIAICMCAKSPVYSMSSWQKYIAVENCAGK
jgi:hypothetical protein